MTKKYWYIGGAIVGVILLMAACSGSNKQQYSAQPVAGAASGAPVVVNTPAPSSGSDGFLTGLLMGHIFSGSSYSTPYRGDTVVNKNYYSSPPPAATTPKPSVPSVSSKPSTSFSGTMRSFSGSSSSFRSSGSSFRSSGSFRVR